MLDLDEDAGDSGFRPPCVGIIAGVWQALLGASFKRDVGVIYRVMQGYIRDSVGLRVSIN